MKIVWAVMRRELAAAFVTPMAYVFMTMFLVLIATGFSIGVTRYALTPAMMIERLGWTIRTQLVAGPWGLMKWGTIGALFALPGLSMRLIAEELSRGTSELLFTAPVTTPQIVAGKYLGSLSLYGLILVLTLPMPAFLFINARPEPAALACAYLALFLYGAVFVAAGLFASALTENQFIALIATYVLVIPLILIDLLMPLARPPFDRALPALSIGHGVKAAARGTLDSSYVVVSLVLIAGFLFLAVRAIERGRRVERGSAAYALIVITALAFVLGLSTQIGHVWDCTAQGANSLSPKTEAALASLDAPVAIHGLYKDSDRRREALWELLDRYRRRSGKITFEIFDPVARPGQLAALDLSVADQNALRDGVSVATSGARKVMFTGLGEEEVTNAILEAGSKEPRRIGFIRGYGEHDPDAAADAGLSRAKEALRAEYYEVVDVRLTVPIEEGVTVLVAAGLRSAIPADDLARLTAWLEQGGRLLVLADPETASGLDSVTSRWGLRGRGIQVLDRGSNLRGRPEIPVATRFSTHPIVRGFSAGLPVALPLPGAVEDFEPGDPGVFHDGLVRSSRESEGLTATGSREQGPFSLAAAAWKTVQRPGAEGTETRLVLVGDAAFATNAFLAEMSNRNFFLNCVGWLSRSRGLVSIRVDPLKGQVLTFRQRELSLLQFLTLAPIVFVIVTGAAVYFRRRAL